MTSPRPCSDLRRRTAGARSRGEEPAVSSMKILARARSSAAADSLAQSSSSKKPLRTRLRSTRPPGAEHTVHERFLAHFQRKDGHGHARGQGRAYGQIEGESRLAHRGAGRDDDKIRWLQSGGELVERRYPVATPVVTFLLLYRAVSSSIRCGPDRCCWRRFCCCPLRNGKNGLFRLVQKDGTSLSNRNSWRIFPGRASINAR